MSDGTQKVDLGVESYESMAKSFSAQRMVNLYAEKGTRGSKGDLMLLGTPGLKLFTTIGSDPIYGMIEVSGVLYVISGNDVYTITDVGGTTLIGSLGSVDSKVSLAHDGSNIMAVKQNGEAYVITATSVTLITDPDLLTPSDVVWKNGYFVISERNGTQIQWAFGAPTSWDALNFGTAEASADKIVGLLSDHGDLWVFGERSTEIWINTGFSNDRAFRRRSSGIIQVGCAAKHSIAKIEGSVSTILWLGNDLVVYMTNQYAPQRISTPGIEAKIAKLSVFDDAEASVYTQEGHKFYCLTFPTSQITLCYDLATRLWHERESLNKGRWRVSEIENIYDKNLAGDFETGALYEIDPETYTENGDYIIRYRTTGVFDFGDNLKSFAQFVLAVEPGQGLNSGQGSDPQMMLSWSDDNGFTFKNELWRSMGSQGAYNTRLVWNKLGSSRSRIFKFQTSEPIKVAITAGYARVG